MITFKEYCKDYLVENGFFETDADLVLEIMISDDSSEAMRDRWNDDVDGYPEIMKTVVVNVLRKFALDWIDANIPQAWFRPMFA